MPMENTLTDRLRNRHSSGGNIQNTWNIFKNEKFYEKKKLKSGTIHNSTTIAFINYICIDTFCKREETIIPMTIQSGAMKFS